jgi:hypothetical protein
MVRIINPATSCSRRRKRPGPTEITTKYHQKFVTLPTTAMIGLVQVVLCIIIGGDARLLCHSFQIPASTTSSVAKSKSIVSRGNHRRQYYTSSSSRSKSTKTTTTTTTCLSALHLLNFEALESSFTHIATLPDTLDFMPTYADVQSLAPKLPELPFNKLADQLRSELGT